MRSRISSRASLKSSSFRIGLIMAVLLYTTNIHHYLEGVKGILIS
jgi:hypothetical protein